MPGCIDPGVLFLRAGARRDDLPQLSLPVTRDANRRSAGAILRKEFRDYRRNRFVIVTMPEPMLRRQFVMVNGLPAVDARSTRGDPVQPPGRLDQRAKVRQECRSD